MSASITNIYLNMALWCLQLYLLPALASNLGCLHAAVSSLNSRRLVSDMNHFQRKEAGAIKP